MAAYLGGKIKISLVDVLYKHIRLPVGGTKGVKKAAFSVKKYKHHGVPINGSQKICYELHQRNCGTTSP